MNLIVAALKLMIHRNLLSAVIISRISCRVGQEESGKERRKEGGIEGGKKREGGMEGEGWREGEKERGRG